MKHILFLSVILSAGCSFLTGAFRDICGDGFVNGVEECDDANDIDTDGCVQCVLAACGDGIIDSSEQCDDGNTSNGDGCGDDCQVEPVCGNNQLEAGEQCDDGNASKGDGCDASCQRESLCGNGVIEGDEECDNPNDNNCDALCRVIPFNCGDGIVNTFEECDDANDINADGCETNCTLICGTGSQAVSALLFEGNCYLGFDENLSWQAAQEDCENKGGHLAVITSAGENNVARSLLDSGFGPWIGFNDIVTEAGTTAANFISVTGEPLSFDGFSQGPPKQPDATNTDEDCVHFFNENLPPHQINTWNDIGCDGGDFTLVSGYICEIEAQ